MNLTLTSRTSKYLLIAINFVFVITGIVLIAIGVTAKTVYSEYHTFLDDKYFSLPNMLIATGSIIFFVSFLGCQAAYRNSSLLCKIFGGLLIVIFIFELSIGIAGYVLRNGTYEYLETELEKNMKYYNTSEPIVSAIWDLIQSRFECCGVNGPSDWNNTLNGDELPMSCCPKLNGIIGVYYCNTNIGTNTRRKRQVNETPTSVKPTSPPPPIINASDATTTTTTTSNISTITTTTTLSPPTLRPNSTSAPYHDGCAPKFGVFVRSHAADLAGAGIALAIIQLLGIAMAFHLSKYLKGYYST